jgi:hypothetical protein
MRLAKSQDRGCVLGGCLTKSDPKGALWQRFAAKQTVPKNGIKNPVWCIQGGDLAYAVQASASEIDSQIGQLDATLPSGIKKRFLHSVGLRPDAVEQHAPNLLAVDDAPLENMFCRPVPIFVGIGRRKHLVARAADRLKAGACGTRIVLRFSTAIFRRGRSRGVVVAP